MVFTSNRMSSLASDGVRHDRSHPIVRIHESLRPLHELTGVDFIAAWFQIIDAHHRAWVSGIQHKDVRLCNLMHYRRPDHSVGAMLLDWDHSLRQLESENEPILIFAEARMPDAVPFLAIDLLTPDGLKGNVAVLYRHELESFIWVLIWAVCCYDNGTMIRSAPDGMSNWNVRQPLNCGSLKHAFILRNEAIKPASDGWVYGANLAKRLVRYLGHAAIQRWQQSQDELIDQATPSDQATPVNQEDDDPEGVWKGFWTYLGKSSRLVPCIAEFMPKGLHKAEADKNKQ
ncbi:hypothetical protein FKP32DRAFT_1675516 [Trametes sanguinea]|nr:hypothetical protein FKP32DRAFT_1675516 [Trametes sanguinea]